MVRTCHVLYIWLVVANMYFRDITWSLIQNPSLWAFAFSQGRDGIAFLQSFRAMRRGYANGTFQYAVISFEKPGGN